MMTKDALIEAVSDYIGKNGGITGGYGWYTGVTSDPQRRLFTDHKVNERDGAWIYEPADPATARETERRLLATGCRGGPGGGKDSSVLFVYAYKITLFTVEGAG